MTHLLQRFALTAARGMVRRNIHGGHRLTHWITHCDVLNKPATYRIGRVDFTVPVDLLGWDRGDILTYDPATIKASAQFIHRLMKDPLFVDCGAHIGIISTLLTTACPEIREILAIEPNDMWWHWTERNLAALGIKTRLIKGAVADFRGKGSLQAAPHSTGPEAYHVAPDPAGNIDVFRLDDLLPDYTGDLILKLDIEGGELQALEGARELIARARTVVAMIEAHPQVSASTGIDPSEYVRFLRSIRPFDVLALPHWVYTDDYDGEAVDPTQPFFSQHQQNIYNLVCAAGPGFKASNR